MLYLNHIVQLGNMEVFCFREKAAECSRSGIVGPVLRGGGGSFFFFVFCRLSLVCLSSILAITIASVVQGM